MNVSEATVVRAGVSGLPALFRKEELGPIEVCRSYLERIERYDGRLNAVLDLRAKAAEEAAAASARRWQEGKPRSELDGVPVAVKANIAVAGLPWHAGIGAYRDRIAREDATCVERLRDAGAIVLGTLNMHEGALGATTDNPWFGRCHNPHRHGYTPGGSSGGSGAAVAAGLCAAALGTDTMGSVRIPSAYCGVFGHKPDIDAVPVAGVVPLSTSLDHVGPHARSAADLAAMLSILTGLETTPESEVTGLRIGRLRWGDRVEVVPSVETAFERALAVFAKLGNELVDLDFSDFDFGRCRRRGLLLSEAEGAVVHERMLAENPEGFSAEFRGLLEWGAARSAEEVEAAREAVRAAAARLAGAFEHCDVVVAPTAPQPAFPFDAGAPANQADFTAVADFAGVPATAVPSGFDDEGLPQSFQIIAPRGRDALAIGVAAAYENAAGHDMRPSEYEY